MYPILDCVKCVPNFHFIYIYLYSVYFIYIHTYDRMRKKIQIILTGRRSSGNTLIVYYQNYKYSDIRILNFQLVHLFIDTWPATLTT
jgi:hypothetical protein